MINMILKQWMQLRQLKAKTLVKLKTDLLLAQVYLKLEDQFHTIQ